jgi:phenylpropionate dioxygenase-like ring-hydroxylating dioxygenase large terminal subunit
VVILDYDDTLLPTTYLDPEDVQDMQNLAKSHKKILNAISEQVIRLLENFLRVSRVMIITNAKQGWVEYSSLIFMPAVHNMIKKHVPVISARGEFEHLFQG